MDECRIKILLVDDSPEFFGSIIEEGKLQEFEELEDHIIFEQDPRKAFERYVSENPCIVILDVRMMGLSGIDIANQIQQYNPEANIFLLTNHPENLDVIRAVHDHLVFGVIPKHSGQYIVTSIMRFMLTYVDRVENLA